MNFVRFSFLAAAAASLGMVAPAGAAPHGAPGREGRTVHDFKAVRIDGVEQSLAAYKGKALLIVNTASRCGFTPQYEGLETLYETYRARGFEVLAFPANDFLGQEPGSDAEIKTFCETKFKTTFPLFSKIHVKGKRIDPLYAYLTRDSGFPGAITWNFNKFLVAPDGRVAARFDSKTKPLAKELTAKLEAILP